MCEPAEAKLLRGVLLAALLLLAGCERGGDGMLLPPSGSVSTELSSDGEIYIDEPATCPQNVRGGITGYIYGYQHPSGYTFDTNWRRTRVLTTEYDVADYDATAGQDLISRDGLAIWYNAGIRLRCTRRYRYFRFIRDLRT
jgi:hypothetical protein